MHDGEDSDKESVEEPPSPDESEEDTSHIVQTGTKPKKKTKTKKKKQILQLDGDDLDHEFLTNVPVSYGHFTPVSKQVSKNVLSLEQKNLNSDNELKKIFGSKVVVSAQKKKARGRAYVKSTWLINAKDNWSQIRKTGLLSSNYLHNSCIHITILH